MSRVRYSQPKLSKIVVILGPTASGKSDIAIKLAKKFDGEIISADSRQIYRGMDIGTGKVTGRPRPVIPSSPRDLVFISGNIPHHMIDIVSPKTDYNVAKFKKAVDKIIPDILRRGKLPIICGGTGFWISAVVDNVQFPKVKPNFKLRKKLVKLPAKKLFLMLKKLDAERAKTIDRYNKVRLIRAIEVARVLGKVPVLSQKSKVKSQKFLQIGISIPKEELHKRIKIRLEKRFKQGMIKEVEYLHYKQGVSWKRLENFGLEYRWIARYLQGKITQEEMVEKLKIAIEQFAKRQMTWFRRWEKQGAQIHWLKNEKEAKKIIKKFLKK